MFLDFFDVICYYDYVLYLKQSRTTFKGVIMATLRLPDGYTFLMNNSSYSGNVMHSHHYHDILEIYYMVSGKCSFFIDGKSYEVLSGDVVLIPEGVIHKTIYEKEEHTRILIECSSHFVPDELRGKIGSMLRLYRNPSISKDIHALLSNIEAEYKSPDEYTPSALLSHMHILFYFLVRNQHLARADEEKNSLVENVVAYIKNNFASDITLGSVAREHFISAEHLSRTFKRNTGFGFNEYLTLVRLQHAEYLLKNREGKSISTIAYSSGFNDSNYFSDKFKKAYGVSPLKYSKGHR